MYKRQQQNAEWMCAIAIVIFSAVQCLISRTQVKQDLRLKRLELAQKLDEQFIHFPYEREKCKIMLDWLMSNRSLFMFLLNKNDYEKFWKLSDFIFEVQSRDNAHYLQKNDDDFFKYVAELQQALGNATYDIRIYKPIKNEKKLEKKGD